MKNVKSPYACILAFCVSATVVHSRRDCCGTRYTGPRAGEVSRVIPAVSIARGGKTI